MGVRGRDGGVLRGRDREIATLDELLGAACAGSGGAVVLEGEAGIGKTALVSRARRIGAERGMRVLHARGSELEDGLAFGVTRELYGPVDADLDFTGAAALAEPALRVASGSAAGGDLFAVLHGLYWLTADLATTAPVLVAVDDAHWCDEPSLRHLAYLAHRLDGLAVALLLAARPADAGRARMLDAVGAEPWSVVHRLARLPEAAVHAVVASTLGGEPDAEFAAACDAATGGNPFLLTELLSEADLAGLAPTARDVGRLRALTPPGVQRAVEARLARLPAAATTLARAAAVLGDGTSLHRAARLAGLTAADAGPLADALVAARVLQPRVALSFVHPLVRSAVSAGMGPSVAGRWHRRAADLLAADGVPGDELVPHLLASPPAGDPRVVAALRDAAQRAGARGAPDVAARHLRRALAEPPDACLRAGLLHELGVAEARALRPEAPDTLAEALAATTDPASRGRIALSLLRSHFVTGRIAEAVGTCERVLDELGRLDDADPDLTLDIEADLMVAGLQELRTRPSTSARLRRRTAPEPEGPSQCRMLAALAMEEVLLAGDPDRAAELAEKALVDGHLVVGDAIAILPCAVAALTFSGRIRRSVQVWDDLLPALRRRGDVWGTAMALSFRGYAAHHAGDLPRAVADLRLALAIGEGTGGAMQVYSTGWLAAALIDADELAEVDELLATLPSAVDETMFARNFVLSARGLLRLARRRAADAAADLRECGRRMHAWQMPGPALCPWRPGLARALHACGDLAGARAAADDALDAARHWATPHVLGDALRAAGLVTGDVELLEEAVAVAAEGESPLDHARALADLGGALRHAGSVRAAREPLRKAVDLAERCGATAVARRARDELLATGARPRTLRSTGAGALTATQRRVAAMAAEGQTSREIAQALFVSRKTVETHLTQAFRKLGISARSQLAEALGAGGPVR
ncbi:MAG: AAA family ATPase [Pseudonocardia sp.]